MNMDRYLIGLDWGISSFRAYLMDGKGEIVDTIVNQSGILQVGNRSFEEVLKASIGHWLSRYPDAPIIASGMIGSRQGWLEATRVGNEGFVERTRVELGILAKGAQIIPERNYS
jgi:2-dehydro-3-deoxygalactonokinase